MRDKKGQGSPNSVILQIIWRKTLHAIWRTLPVWVDWRNRPQETSRWIGSIRCLAHPFHT